MNQPKRPVSTSRVLAFAALGLLVFLLPSSVILDSADIAETIKLAFVLGIMGAVAVLGAAALFFLLRENKMKPPHRATLPIRFYDFDAVKRRLDAALADNNFSEKEYIPFDGAAGAHLYTPDSAYRRWTRVVLIRLAVLDVPSLRTGWEMSQALLEDWLDKDANRSPILAVICADTVTLPPECLRHGLSLSYGKCAAMPVVLALDQCQLVIAMAPEQVPMHGGVGGMHQFALQLLGVQEK